MLSRLVCYFYFVYMASAAKFFSKNKVKYVTGRIMDNVFVFEDCIIG